MLIGMVDPVGSTMGGGVAGSYAIEGIGNTFMPDTMDMNLVDKVLKVSDEEAIEEVRLLAAREGLLVGSSSEAALVAVRKIAAHADKGMRIVTVFPDRGDRYFSKHLLVDEEQESSTDEEALPNDARGGPAMNNLEGSLLAHDKLHIALDGVAETALLPRSLRKFLTSSMICPVVHSRSINSYCSLAHSSMILTNACTLNA